MVLICFITSLVNLVMHKIEFSELLSKTGLYFLYTIGYGALEGDAMLQNILAMLGIISLALMSTFLTINLFWRLDDVTLCKNISINDDIIVFTFNNNGRPICDIKASFILYDEFTSENLEEPKEYYMPMLLKNGHWNLKVDLHETFWYKVIYNLLSNQNIKLYCIFSFVDTQNGQNSIRVEEFKKDSIIKNDKLLEYEEFITPSIIPCNSLHSVENGCTVQLTNEQNLMVMNYKFNKNCENTSFAMAFYSFHNNALNLEKYNKETTFLEFSIASEKKVNMKLEIKMFNNFTCTKELEFNEKAKTIQIPLNEIDGDLENIKEICFTIFATNNYKDNALQISDLKIITQ